ncbi:MAG: hypothetical protein LBU50_02210 [Cellulomonas sp.]|nr:hypothetical protein [Cellulomonas sp.]
MTDPTEERLLGDPPELPDHVWTAALDHAFDPLAEPDTALVPDDPAGLDTGEAGDDLALDTGLDTGLDDTGHDPLGAVPDSFDFDHSYGDDTSGPDYDSPGFSDTDGYF